MAKVTKLGGGDGEGRDPPEGWLEGLEIPPPEVGTKVPPVPEATTGERIPGWIREGVQGGGNVVDIRDHRASKVVDDAARGHGSTPGVGRWSVGTLGVDGVWNEVARGDSALDALEQCSKASVGKSGTDAEPYAVVRDLQTGEVANWVEFEKEAFVSKRSAAFDAALKREQQVRADPRPSNAPPSDDEDKRPQVVRDFAAALAAFKAEDLESDDPKVAFAAAGAWGYLLGQAKGLSKKHDLTELTQGLAPRLASEFRGVISPSGTQRSDTKMPQRERGAGERGGPSVAGALGPGGGGGGFIDGLARAPFTALSAGGSMAVNALKAAHSGVSRMMQSHRVSSSGALAQQVNSLAADIERECQWLQAHGLDGIVREMKVSGDSLVEALPKMQRGGPLEHLGLQFKGLMQDSEFSDRFGRMVDAVDRFGVKAQRYATVAHGAGLDPEDVLEEAGKRVSDAVEDIPVEKNGRFSALAERTAEIMEKIKAMLNRLMGRFAPGRGV